MFRTFHDDLKDMGEGIESYPTQVVTMYGNFCFVTFKEAKEKFPTLDPFHNTKDFTWATKDGNRMRFEDWEINNIMSI